MSHFNIPRARKSLQDFDFHTLFIEELGWNQPPATRPDTFDCDGVTYTRRQIAELGGVIVFELTAADGQIPPAKARDRVQKQISHYYYENLLIFVDRLRTQSVWYWVKREGRKRYPRSHYYVRGQTGDLFLGKIAGMFVDMSELDEAGNLPVIEVARRVQASLDVEQVTKKFYNEFSRVQVRFTERIGGIDDASERRWYTSVILNRLMFTYFLQRKGFIDRDMDYLSHKLQQNPDFYRGFLRPLFFSGFAKPADQRDPAIRSLLGRVPYLNGGLFLPHPIEEKYGDAITIPDAAFEELLDLFGRYSWNLDDTPGGQDDEINPAVLGYIFEKYINQKAFGAYYTRTEITTYLCERTIHQLILDKVAEINQPLPGQPRPPTFDTIGDLLLNLDAPTCLLLITNILPQLSLLDPACGSGAFLVAALQTLIPIYQGIIGRIPFLKNAVLSQWLERIERQHTNLDYFIKKRIITDNLFGVDIMAEAVEIARLRLFLALVASARTVDDLEPLPNIDFNVLPGNSLIGLLRVDETQYQARLGEESYAELVARKTVMVQQYRNATQYEGLKNNARAVTSLRDLIQRQREATNATLNGILLDQFKALKIKYEQATWDAARNKAGKSRKRDLTPDDIAALHPFHWGYEFHEVMNTRGGFDAIITNPPWEALKPQAKEFFADYSDAISKKKMTIKAFKRVQAQLMQDPKIATAWLARLGRYRYESNYFSRAPQYAHQRTKVNGRTTGSDINLYKLFTERCYHLLREGGVGGLVIPSGIYTDLGATGLRQLLFAHTQITGLFGFENRKAIFERVDSRFKFVVLTFKKGGTTTRFPSAFMRHDVAELAHFPSENTLWLDVDLIKRLSPGSWSLMEFDSALDVQIAKKMLRFPALGETVPDRWNVKLTREFDMTNDSHLFHTEPGPGRLPLYEGKMIHQFTHQWGKPRYWVEESAGRRALLGRHEDTGQRLDYQTYRLGFRDIARNTDTRTMISTVIPPAFHGNKLPTTKVFDANGQRMLDDSTQVFLCAVWNSFVVDWLVRMKVSATLNFFYVYQLPVPRLTETDAAFAPIVERAAKLICTTPEFDALAQSVGLGDHTHGVTDPAARAQLRAELDGIIAHLYRLTEDEYRHILSTFPLVEEQVKQNALAAYRADSCGGCPAGLKTPSASRGDPLARPH